MLKHTAGKMLSNRAAAKVGHVTMNSVEVSWMKKIGSILHDKLIIDILSDGVKHADLFAIKKIIARKELTVDYRSEYCPTKDSNVVVSLRLT